MRKKIDIRELAYTLTDVDVKEAINQEKIRAMLGIYTVYDDAYTQGNNEYVPSMYNSWDEYEMDKNEADNYICRNREVPKQLAQRLIAARIELENRGLIEKYEEMSMKI